MIMDYTNILAGLPVMYLIVVVAMDNVEDIENYDITAGYPEKLNLT